MGVTAIICIAAVVIAIVIILTIIIYNQMLLLNEVNKRLLLIAKESIDKERSTQEELSDALLELQSRANEEQSVPEEQNQIYHDPDLD